MTRSLQAGTSRAAMLLAWCLIFAAAGSVAAEDRFMARAYQVNHRPLADAADVVAPVLSPEGTVTLRPRLNILVVQDRGSVLDRVQALLNSFDLPPKNVEVTLSLFMGLDRRATGGRRGATGTAFSAEVRGVIDTLGDVTRWVAYEPLGTRSVTGVEGSAVTTSLSDDYRVVFTVQSVHETAGVVRFERVSLQKLSYSDDGAEKVEDLYTAGMVLTAGRLHVVGAARQPGSDRALFLIVQVGAR